jgi:tRNA A-37 threonylcarbamoyl transferase component Bud32
MPRWTERAPAWMIARMNDAAVRALADSAARTLAALGDFPPTRSVHPDAATLAAPSIEPRTPTLPQVAISTEGSEAQADLVALRVIGEGGMGIVELARQRSLDREVAIKRVKNGVANESGVVSLLSEAKTTGALEHPSIVPVHALGRDRDGAPLMVMKKIEGVSFKALLADPEHPHWRHAHGDRLARVVSIVQRVCDAVAFAHSRGVIHRDIKPENVMLGEFGEVYLLDWGIAIEKDKPLPKTAIAGTPSYMAPEMLAPESGHIDERSDVFLLGATLHEAIAGAPPYSGPSLLSVLHAVAFAEPPSYGDDVPPELAAITKRAMHRDRDQRFASAFELQRALERFLQHRAAAALLSAAQDRLHALERATTEKDVAAAHVHTLFHECRFAFEQAAREWPDDEGAQAGRRRCLELMFRWEIAREDRDAAAALFEALESPPALATVLAELEERLAAAASERDRLSRLDQEMDFEVGGRQRTVALRIMAALLAVAAVGVSSAVISGLAQPSVRLMVLTTAVGLSGALAIGWRVRKALFANRINRQFVLTIAATAAIIVVHRLVGLSTGETIADLASADALIGATALVTLALTVRRVYLVGAILFTAASVVVKLLPEVSIVPMIGAATLTLATVLAAPRSLQKPLLTTVSRVPRAT